jgi:hypothetical protein
MIRSMGMENFIGQMVGLTEDTGRTVNSMEKAFIEVAMESNERENGLMGKR